jgi:act minimal PKS acyl carrier protein
MSGFELRELRQIMRSVAGAEQGVSFDGEIGEVSFDDLGYDSLAVLEVMSEVQRRHGIEVPEEVIFDLRTPQQAVDYVNGLSVGV